MVLWIVALSSVARATPPMDDSATDLIFAPIAGIDSRATPPTAPTAIDPIRVAPETQIGTASYYGQRFAGRRTASGEPFDPEASTAAHRTLPFGTIVRITNTANDRSVEAVINDRGPFIRHRIIDVSRAIARQLEFLDRGVAEVHVEVLPPPRPRNPRRRRQCHADTDGNAVRTGTRS